MSVSASNNYTISADDVLKHFTDDKYASAKYESLGNREYIRTSNTTNGNVTTLKQTRKVHTDVPGFAKKILNEWTELEETYTWTDAGDTKTCDIQTNLVGQPAKITGTIVLTNTPDGCNEDVTMAAEIKIPLIGKKLQKKAEEDIQNDLRRENDFNNSYFA
nr:hypothetical protein [uncultured bacterium]